MFLNCSLTLFIFLIFKHFDFFIFYLVFQPIFYECFSKNFCFFFMIFIENTFFLSLFLVIYHFAHSFKTNFQLFLKVFKYFISMLYLTTVKKLDFNLCSSIFSFFYIFDLYSNKYFLNCALIFLNFNVKNSIFTFF